jgi:hypothetical protein
MALLQSFHTPTRLNMFFVSICELGMPKKNLAKNATFEN